MCFVTQGVGAKGFERRSGGLAERSIESLNTGEAFPQFGAHTGGDLVERIQHVLLVRRGRFFAGNIVAAGGVLSVEGNNIGFAQGSDGAAKDRLDPFPLTDLPGDLRGNGLVLLAAKELETPAKVLLANDVEHGRLANCTRRAWFRVVSKTSSPVLLMKSATMMLSFEVPGFAGSGGGGAAALDAGPGLEPGL